MFVVGAGDVGTPEAGEETRSRYVFILFAERASPPRSLFDDANLSRRLIKRAPTSLIRRCCSLRGDAAARHARPAVARLPKPVNSANYYELPTFRPRTYRAPIKFLRYVVS